MANATKIWKMKLVYVQDVSKIVKNANLLENLGIFAISVLMITLCLIQLALNSVQMVLNHKMVIVSKRIKVNMI